MTTPPKTGFVAPFGSAVEPLVHTPQPVQTASIRRVGVIDDTIFEHEGAHARLLAPEGGPVGTDARRELRAGPLLAGLHVGLLVVCLEVVLDVRRLLLLQPDTHL